MPRKQYNGNVYTKKYIQYNENGEVFGITGIPDDNFKNFEIDLDLIPNFINYKKDFKKYSIDYFLKIAEGLITDEEEIEDYFKNEFVYYTVPIEFKEDFDILIEHDSENRTWTVTSDCSKMMLETVGYVPIHVTVKNNPNFLISSYFIDAKDLYRNKVQLNFLSDIEKDITKISLLTNRKFKNYSVRLL